MRLGVPSEMALMLHSYAEALQPSMSAMRSVGGVPPMSRGGRTGVPAARRAERKQRNIAAKR